MNPRIVLHLGNAMMAGLAAAIWFSISGNDEYRGLSVGLGFAGVALLLVGALPNVSNRHLNVAIISSAVFLVGTFIFVSLPRGV